MKELIAKRYIRALKETVDDSSMEKISTIFDALSSAFDDTRFAQMMQSPDVAAADKEALLLESIKASESAQVENLIRLLVENGRIDIIPAIAEEMKKDSARMNKSYTGVIYSNSDIDAATITDLGSGLGKKVDAEVVLEFVKTDFDGVKVEVEDLGIEINFSKSRMNMQLIEHILKAI